MSTNYTPTAIHINAAPGNPSTFWLSASGKYYRTKSEALADSGNAVNPDDFAINKSFFAQYGNWIIGIIVVLALAGGAWWYLKKRG